MTRKNEPTPERAIELGLDKRWLETVAALRAIADDEGQSGERRRKALAAWRQATSSGHVASHVIVHNAAPQTLGNHRGKDEDRTQAMIEGWPA